MDRSIEFRAATEYGMRPVPSAGLAAAVNPVVERLHAYDRMRQRLMEIGASAQDLEDLAALLRDRFSVKAGGQEHPVALENPEGLKLIIQELSEGALHLECSLDEYGFPGFYLCRLHRDCGTTPAAVVEDLYISPGYPMPDERFVRLTRNGNPISRMRLSQYRQGTRGILGADGNVPGGAVDDFLHGIGSLVFQAAWSENQRVAMLAARHFGLQDFWRAVELLCLVRGSDLCELRGSAEESWFSFFRQVYPQPAFVALLEMLPHTDGERLVRLHSDAASRYEELRSAFRSFLLMEVQREGHHGKLPLFKFIFGNLDRLDRVSRELVCSGALRRRSGRLESISRQIVQSMVGNASDLRSCWAGTRGGRVMP